MTSVVKDLSCVKPPPLLKPWRMPLGCLMSPKKHGKVRILSIWQSSRLRHTFQQPTRKVKQVTFFSLRTKAREHVQGHRKLHDPAVLVCFGMVNSPLGIATCRTCNDQTRGECNRIVVTIFTRLSFHIWFHQCLLDLCNDILFGALLVPQFLQRCHFTCSKLELKLSQDAPEKI